MGNTLTQIPSLPNQLGLTDYQLILLASNPQHSYGEQSHNSDTKKGVSLHVESNDQKREKIGHNRDRRNIYIVGTLSIDLHSPTTVSLLHDPSAGAQRYQHQTGKEAQKEEKEVVI